MRFIFNRWHMTIRKHRTTKSNNPKDRPFDYDIPAELMPKLFNSVRLNMKMRDLGGCPNLDSPSMAKYKEIPAIKALLDWVVPEPKPEKLSKDDDNMRGKKRKIDEDEDHASISSSDGNKGGVKRVKKNGDKDDLMVDTDTDGAATDDADDEDEGVKAVKVKKGAKRKRILGEDDSDDSDDAAEMGPAKKKK